MAELGQRMRKCSAYTFDSAPIHYVQKLVYCSVSLDLCHSIYVKLGTSHG